MSPSPPVPVLAPSKRSGLLLKAFLVRTESSWVVSVYQFLACPTGKSRGRWRPPGRLLALALGTR